MLILSCSPENKAYYIAAASVGRAARPTSMLQPTIGWRAETVGDDIAWMRFGKDGSLRGQPRVGFFRGRRTRHQLGLESDAMKTIEEGNTVFTNAR